MATGQQKAHVLVIDDDKHMREFITDALQEEGYRVTATVDGVEGLDQYHVCDCDVVITDLSMPNKDGLEVIQELRWLYPPIPIIAISGADRSGILMQVARLYETDYTLNKPFSIEQLLSTVQSAIQQKKAAE